MNLNVCNTFVTDVMRTIDQARRGSPDANILKAKYDLLNRLVWRLLPAVIFWRHAAPAQAAHALEKVQQELSDLTSFAKGDFVAAGVLQTVEPLCVDTNIHNRFEEYLYEAVGNSVLTDKMIHDKIFDTYRNLSALNRQPVDNLKAAIRSKPTKQSLSNEEALNEVFVMGLIGRELEGPVLMG